MQSNIAVPDLLQMTAFCTEELKTSKTRPLLQEDLDSLEEWEHMWQMEFNPSKCNVIHIMPNKQRKVLTASYFLHGQTTTSTSKYLGITISSDLS